MKKFKKLLVICLSMLMVISVVAGCGNKGGSGDKEILFWAESVGINPEKFDEYVSYFNENNP